MNFYNDNDLKSAAWLRELTAASLIPPGTIDSRPIQSIQPDDLPPFTQCHFFAGIGGWPYALKLARWPLNRPVWTGSCPCQPFSCAGKGHGASDARHLWPEFLRLISERHPSVVFGEQVTSKAGREWLAGVRADLEALGYAVGAADLCAAGVGAPHIRQRLYWVAHAQSDKREQWGTEPEGGIIERGCSDGRLAHAQSQLDGSRDTRTGRRTEPANDSTTIRLDDPDQPGSQGRSKHTEEHTDKWTPRASGITGRMGNTECNRAQRPRSFQCQPHAASPWSAFTLLPMLDRKTRRIEPGSFPLAHGVSDRVGLLRGYGNAIVPQIAAEFVRAFMECEAELPRDLQAPGAEQTGEAL